MKKYEENMKKYKGITLPRMGRKTSKNFEHVQFAKYEFRGGVGERKT